MRSVVRPRCKLFLETPASGSQESPAWGRGAEGTHTPPVSREGSAPPPPPRGEGGEAREGEGREQGTETGGAVSRPTPRLDNNGFPLLPPAAHSSPRPYPAPRGASGAPQPLGPWEPEPRLMRMTGFPVRKLEVTLEKPVGPTWSQPQLATFHYSLVTSFLL